MGAKVEWGGGVGHTHSTLCRILASLQRCRTVDEHVCSRNDREGRPSHCSSRLSRNEGWARRCCLEYGPGQSLGIRIRVLLALKVEKRRVSPVISASGNLSAKFLDSVSGFSDPFDVVVLCPYAIPSPNIQHSFRFLKRSQEQSVVQCEEEQVVSVIQPIVRHIRS